MALPSPPSANVSRLLAMQNQKIVLDTNILIQATGGKTKEHRACLRDFCTQNVVLVTDTVYYEFLRNCNFDTFRRRRVLIEDWPGMERMRILRDTEQVQNMREHLALLYLYVMRSDLRRFIALCAEDLWIAAAAVHYDADAKIDRILTTDHSGDFPPELFSSEQFDLGDGLVVYLKTFQRTKARRLWMEMQQAGNMSVSLRPLFS